MAYGDLAGVTPVAGLYVALGALVMYALFGTSKQVSMGPEPTAALMTAAAIAPLAGGDAVRHAALAALLALLVGVVALLQPGLIVYRFDAPLVFADAAHFTERLGELVANASPGLKCVVLNAEAISDFDSTAAEVLENLDVELERVGADLWIACANAPLRELLTTTGVVNRLGAERIYPSVRAAVEAYHAHHLA